MRWSMPTNGGKFHAIDPDIPAYNGDGFALCNRHLKLYGITGVYGEELERGMKCKNCMKKEKP